MSNMLDELLKAAGEKEMRNDPETPMPNGQVLGHAEVLKEIYETFQKAPEFKPGDLVVKNEMFAWNRRYPRIDQPGVVIKIKDQILQANGGSADFGETVLVMMIDENKNKPIGFWYSTAELKHYEPAPAEAESAEESEEKSEAVA